MSGVVLNTPPAKINDLYFMKRKDFLRTTSLAGMALLARPAGLFRFFDPSRVGVQLYTVRDLMASDPMGTLKAIAAIGYKEIEPAGYNEGKFYGMVPSEFKKVLDDLGLTAISGHHGYNAADFDQSLTDCAAIGQKYYVIPSPPVEYKPGMDFFKVMDGKTAADFISMAELFNTLGKKATAAGLTLVYHNHNFEFKQYGVKNGYELLVEHTDPAIFNFEMDLYWVNKAGKNPLDYFKRYPGRFKLWHVKDMEKGADQHFAAVGTGIINFKEIFSHARQAGMEHFFVEQDNSYGLNPLENLKTSYTNLIKIDRVRS